MTQTGELARWMASALLPHEGEVRRWLSRACAGQQDVDDVIQECYCRIWSARVRNEIANPRAYFFQTARRVLIDCHRRDRVVSLDAVARIEVLPIPCDDPLPDRAIDARRELDRIRATLATMPDRARNIFEMRKIAGLSQREIAERLGVTENVVENDTARVLRQILISYEDFPARHDGRQSAGAIAARRRRSREESK